MAGNFSQSILILIILYDFYDSLCGEHTRFLQTYQITTKNVHFLGMKKHVDRWIDVCKICQKHKTYSLSLVDLIKLLSVLVELNIFGRT